MRKLILIFNMLLFWGICPFLFAQEADPLQEKISALKSVKSLPQFITWSYSFTKPNGKIEIGYPILSKKQEKEYKVKNSALAKQAEKMKKEINQLFSNEKYQVQWAQRKDTIKIQEQEFEGIVLECSFVKIRTITDVQADIEEEKQKILAEKAEFDKTKAEWQKKFDEEEHAWEEFEKIPYLFNFNAKLAGSKFVHTEKIDEVSFLGIKLQEAKTIYRSLTFLSETEVKYQKGDSFEVYDIVDRNSNGLSLKHKNSKEESFIDCWTDNTFVFGGNVFDKVGYKPTLKITGKSFSKAMRKVSFIKSYGPENTVASFVDERSYSEYTFLPKGKIKIITYEYSGAPELKKRESSYDELVKKIDDTLQNLNTLPLEQAENFLESLRQSLEGYSLKFDMPHFTVSEDTESYTWQQKGPEKIILKNAYSSSDNKYFYYAQDYRLLSMDKDFKSVDWDRSLYLVK